MGWELGGRLAREGIYIIMLICVYGRNQYNIVKQLSSNYKKYFERNCNGIKKKSDPGGGEHSLPPRLLKDSVGFVRILTAVELALK